MRILTRSTSGLSRSIYPAPPKQVRAETTEPSPFPAESVQLTGTTESQQQVQVERPQAAPVVEVKPGHSQPPVVLAVLQKSPPEASEVAPSRSPSKPSANAKEVADTAAFMAAMLGPRLGTRLLAASNLVAIAGERVRNFYSIPAPEPTKRERDRLKALNTHLRSKGLRVSHTDGELITENLHAAERASRENPWMGRFQARDGWAAYDQWLEGVWQKDRDEKAQGTLLGYPRPAIEDATEIFGGGYEGPTSVVRVPHSQGIVISVKPHNLENPEILAWQKRWGQLSKEVYEQPALQPLLGKGPGKFEIPPALNSQHTDQTVLPALRRGRGEFQRASVEGKTLKQALAPLGEHLEEHGIPRSFLSPYRLLKAGQWGIEPFKAYAEVFDQNKDWKKELLCDALLSKQRQIEFNEKEMRENPNSKVDYSKVLAELRETMATLSEQIADPERKAPLP